jgi:hypothetical protein
MWFQIQLHLSFYHTCMGSLCSFLWPYYFLFTFKYLGTTVTNQNLIQEEIKRRLNSGNASYHSVQNLLSSHLLSKNLKIRIYKTIILSVVLYGCQTWSLTLRVEHRLSVSSLQPPHFEFELCTSTVPAENTCK